MPISTARLRCALRLLGSMLLALALVGPARSATTDWVTSQGGRVRLAAAAPRPDGTVQAAIVIDLNPGWTTYWRSPGESGVPPRLSTEGSANVASARLAFPAPVAIKEAGLTVIGYDHSVALPLTIRKQSSAAAGTLKAKLFIGVCREICIPVQADFTLDLPAGLSGNGKTADAMQVRLAYAALPDGESTDFRIVSAASADDGKALNVAVVLPDREGARNAELFAAGPDAWTLGIARLTGTSGRTAHFSLPITSSPDGADADGIRVHFVVRDGNHAIAATKSVE